MSLGIASTKSQLRSSTFQSRQLTIRLFWCYLTAVRSAIYLAENHQIMAKTLNFLSGARIYIEQKHIDRQVELPVLGPGCDVGEVSMGRVAK